MKLLSQDETNTSLKPYLRPLLDSLDKGESLAFTKEEWSSHWKTPPRALVNMTMGAGQFSTRESKDKTSWIISKL